MIFKSITFRGFKAFRDPATLIFPTNPCAFACITGRNLAQPELGANGAGKSTIWDALCWIMYGQTARGVKGKNVLPWTINQNDPFTGGSLTLEHKGEVRTIHRTQSPNSLRMQVGKGEARTVEQDELEAWFGFDRIIFLNTVLMGQFGAFFFDLGATEKLKIFADALKLDIWLEHSKRAAKHAASTESALHDCEVARGRAKAQVEEITGQMESFKTVGKEWKASQDARRKEITKAIKAQETRISGLEEIVADAREQHTAQKKAVEDLECKDKKAAVEAGKVRTSLETKEGEIRGLEGDIRALRDKIANAKKLSGTACPTCAQLVTKTHCGSVVKNLEMNVGMAQASLKQAAASRDDLVGQQELWERRIEGTAGKLKEQRAKLGACESAVRNNAGALGIAKSTLASLNSDLARLDKEVSPVVAQEKTAAQRLKEAKATVVRLDEEHATHSKALATMQFWAKEFKTVRLWLVNQALRELELEVNSSLVQLGLVGWLVEFAVERETAVGGVSRGFVVNITAPGAPESVPWESWSGGETQRLRLAGAMGMASFLRNRIGINPSIEVWDEPTEHLSKEGIEDLLAHLRVRADTEKRQVWLIDHRSLDAGQFDKRYLVEKHAKGGAVLSELNSQLYEKGTG